MEIEETAHLRTPCTAGVIKRLRWAGYVDRPEGKQLQEGQGEFGKIILNGIHGLYRVKWRDLAQESVAW